MTPPYQPVGECIYCGATRYSLDRNKLSEEHIVPFCLDGIHTLPEASCKKCEGKTGGLEQSLFGDHGAYRAARVHAGSRSRDRKTKKTVPLWIGEGANAVRYDLPGDTAPRWIFLMPLPPPAVLTTGSTEPSTETSPETFTIGVAELNPGATQQLGQPVGMPGFSPIDLARLLAKVAHGYAVAELGIDGFKPLLVDLILGKPGPVPWALIGGYGVGTNRPAQPGDQAQWEATIESWREAEPYSISLEIEEVAGKRFVVVNLHLLQRAGFMPYRVVAGVIEGEVAELKAVENVT